MRWFYEKNKCLRCKVRGFCCANYCKFTVSRLYETISEFHSLLSIVCLIAHHFFRSRKTVKQFREITSDFHHQQEQKNTIKHIARNKKTVCCRCIHAAAFFSNKSLLRNRIVRNNRIVVRLNGPVDEKNDENDG